MFILLEGCMRFEVLYVYIVNCILFKTNVGVYLAMYDPLELERVGIF